MRDFRIEIVFFKPLSHLKGRRSIRSSCVTILFLKECAELGTRLNNSSPLLRSISCAVSSQRNSGKPCYFCDNIGVQGQCKLR
jgi:hypothetical protein